MDFLTRLFSSNGFMPYGHCYLWNHGILWLHIASDVLIALAYFSIPLLLIELVRKRKDVAFSWMFVCFAFFIIACGATHIMEVVSIWIPAYWLLGSIKAVTAGASISTAILLAKIMPQLLVFPSPSAMSQRNRSLRLISDCLAGLLAERETEKIVSNFLPRVLKHTGASACFNYLIANEKEMYLHSWLGISDETAQAICSLGVGEAPCGLVAQTQKILVLNDIRNRRDREADLLRPLGVQCYVGIPLMVGSRLLGTLSFASDSKTQFSNDEIAFLQLISGHVAIAMDRIRAEVALVEAKRTAEEANRAKDEFIAALSHELRTPLTPVLFTATAMEFDESLSAETRRQMSLIRHDIELEARLIDDLLDTTRIVRGKFSLRLKITNVHDLLAEAVEIVREDILRKDLTVRVWTAAERVTASADPARLQQVFWNLIKNAIKFTPAHGSIDIRTFNPDPSSLSVEIRDSGIGIAKGDFQRIFHSFEQGPVVGDHRYGGLGLGLAISKAILDLHHGSISVDSLGLECGSVFTVHLPIYERAFLVPAPQEAPQKEKKARFRILLIEDDEQTREVLTRILTRDGHEVQAEGTCATALKALRSRSQTNPFQVVISDLGLPDCSGINLVRDLKSTSPTLTAIALSGYGTDEDIRNSLEAGFSTHLTKPIGIDELRRALAG